MATVLFCTQTAHPRGGVEAWLDGLVAVVRERGWVPVLGLARGSRFHLPEKYHAEHPNVESVELDGRGGTREARVRSILDALHRVRPNVVVPVNLYDVLEASARWKLAGHDCRLVAALHGFQAATVLDLRHFAEFVDRAVTPNRLLLELLVREAGLERTRCHYVPAGCRPRTSLRRARGAGEPIRLGYVGRLDHHDKRVLDLIGLLELLDSMDVRYSATVVGQGESAAELRAGLDGHIQRGVVRMLGWCTGEQLYADVYPNLDAILLFSPSEAGPLVLWEAMLHGVVPITSRYLGSGSEGSLRQDETALLFDVGDLPAAAAAVRRVDQGPAELERLSRAAERLVLERYGLDAHQTGWFSALEGSLEGVAATGALPAGVDRPSGRLEQLGFSPKAAASIRAALGRAPSAKEPGGEWPHCGEWPGSATRGLEQRARTLDAAFVSGSVDPL